MAGRATVSPCIFCTRGSPQAWEHRPSQIPQLVWEPEYEPDIVIDLNAMSIEKSWSVAPLTNGNYCGFDKQRRPTYGLKAQDSPVVPDHRMQPNRAFNPLLHGFRG